jgi:hypothetical protein
MKQKPHWRVRRVLLSRIVQFELITLRPAARMVVILLPVVALAAVAAAVEASADEEVVVEVAGVTLVVAAAVEDSVDEEVVVDVELLVVVEVAPPTAAALETSPAPRLPSE